MRFLLRAPTASHIMDLKKKVKATFEGAATQTGCEVDIQGGDLIKELRNDASLAVSTQRRQALMAGRVL